MDKALMIAKVVIIRLAYVGIGSLITKLIIDKKNEKKAEEA